MQSSARDIKELFFPKQSVQKTIGTSLCILFPLPHSPVSVTPMAKKKEAKFFMLCDSTVKQAMELMAKKIEQNRLKVFTELQIILLVNFHSHSVSARR